MKKLNKFYLSHDHSTTLDMGALVPFCIIDTLPNDRFRISVDSFIRAQPMLAPLMHKVDIKTEFWFVPSRILWEDWENFITGGISGVETPEFPKVTLNSTVGSLANYFGLPIANSLEVSALPFRAYNEIINTRYLDEDIDTLLPQSYASGADTTSNTTLQYRRWAKDYFTTSRASTQRGNDVSIPLSGDGALVADGNMTSTTGGLYFYGNNDHQDFLGDGLDAGPGENHPYTYKSGIKLDNQSLTVNVRDLRLASAIQRYQERSLRYGNRYEEYLASEFGLAPRDSRIQRPEYLGGSSSVLQISEVLQTAEAENTGVGTMRGHGVGGIRQKPIRFKCPEHGFIIGLMTIAPRAVYTQGINKHWRKFTRLDYFTKELSTIGMQEVYQSELFFNGSNYQTIFGYQDRDAEYRQIPNRVTGEFIDTLDYWNLARKFEQAPVLNSDFLKMNPSKRVFAEQTQHSFLAMIRNKVKSYRVVPKYARNILK